MVRITTMCLVFSFLICQLTAQSLRLDVTKAYGVATNSYSGFFDNNGSLELDYLHDLTEHASLLFGAGFRTIDWGNQVNVNFGYQYKYVEKKWFSLSQEIVVSPTFPLFYRNFFVGFGADTQINLNIRLSPKWDFYTHFGGAYQTFPSYKNYGVMYNIAELQIGVGFQYRLRSKGKKALGNEMN